MNDLKLERYAKLLVNYCIQPQKNDVIVINTTTAAEKLLPYLYKYILEKEAFAEFDLQFKGQSQTYYTHASDQQLATLPLLEKEKIKKVNFTLHIAAPTEALSHIPNIAQKKSARMSAYKSLRETKMKRAQEGQLSWTLCNFPTMSLAKAAKMSLKDYTNFLENACFLNESNPEKAWLKLRENQEKYVKVLNDVDTLHFRNENVDLSCRVKNRKWINSDGRRNMPSGEVFTSPIETSMTGHIHFSCASRQYEQVVKGARLEFKNGIVQNYSADKGQKALDLAFKEKNSRKVGEIAIGTNYNIQEISYNTLFDEKIGGTMHLALGNSYPETGGKNISPIHWDLITCMRKGEILADNICIYKNGRFLI